MLKVIVKCLLNVFPILVHTTWLELLGIDLLLHLGCSLESEHPSDASVPSTVSTET